MYDKSEQAGKDILVRDLDGYLGSLMNIIVAHIMTLPPNEPLDQLFSSVIAAPLDTILFFWTLILRNMGVQVGRMENLAEEDYGEVQKPAHLVLTTTQQLSRQVQDYLAKISSAKMEIQAKVPKRSPRKRVLIKGYAEVYSRLAQVERRADKVVPAILASISINEGKRAAKLTRIALLFTPLSLLASILSIDGGSRLGGLKYILFFGIGVAVIVATVALTDIFSGTRSTVVRLHHVSKVSDPVDPSTWLEKKKKGTWCFQAHCARSLGYVPKYFSYNCN